MKILVSLLLGFFSVIMYGQQHDNVTVQKTLKLMGSRFEITVVATNEELGYINIEEAVAEISRIEKLISAWDADSETSKINRNAGIKPVKVSPELFRLIERSKQISELTDGAFDISYSSMDKIWKFDGSVIQKPTDEAIRSSVSKVGYAKIILNSDNSTVYLKEKGMKISFGAIGKGYAADKAKDLLISKGVVSGIINASGDLTTWGTKANGDKWLIGIINPMQNDRIVSWLPVVESSVATSGDYEKYVTIDGKKYSHIIDPRTGYPSTGITQVSIFANSAEFCDALATAIFIMGKDAGLFLINQLDGIEVVLFDDEYQVHKSKGIIFDRDP